MNDLIGYARVSTTDQSAAIQIEQLDEAGCRRVFDEQICGKNKDRPQLEIALDFVKEGDTLLVTRMDRLGRDAADLLNIVKGLEKKGVGFKVTEQPFIDTTTGMGTLIMQMMAAFAEFETSLRLARQLEGIQKAKKAGRYRGRPRGTLEHKHNADDLRARLAGDPKLTKVGLAKELGISESTIHRIFRESQKAP